MSKAKSRKQRPKVGAVRKNHGTGRVELRKDKLYSFVVPQFQGWTPRQPKDRQ